MKFPVARARRAPQPEIVTLLHAEMDDDGARIDAQVEALTGRMDDLAAALGVDRTQRGGGGPRAA